MTDPTPTSKQIDLAIRRTSQLRRLALSLKSAMAKSVPDKPSPNRHGNPASSTNLSASKK